MLKRSLLAAALFAMSAGPIVSATSASAQDFRAQSSSAFNDGYAGKYNDGGLGRYCPPGYYPHSFPSGNGIRCEAADGRLIYNPPF